MNDSVYSLPKGKVFSGYEAEYMYTNVYDGPDSFLKDPVNILVTSNVVLPDYVGTDQIRVLLIGQTDKIENGIYVINNNILSRSSDMSDGLHAAGSLICALDVNNYYTCTCDYNQDVVGINELIFSIIYLTPYNLLGTGATDPVGAFSYIQFYKTDPSNHVNSSQYFNDDNIQSIVNYRLLTGYKLILGKPSATTTITSDEDFSIQGNSALNLYAGLSGNGSGSGDITMTSSNDLEINSFVSNLTATNSTITSDTIKIITDVYSQSDKTNVININGINFFNSVIFPITQQTIPTIQTITSTAYSGTFTIQDATSLGPLASVLIRVNNTNIVQGNQLIFVSVLQSNSNESDGIPLVEIYNVQNGFYDIMLLNISSLSSLPSENLVIQYYMVKTI
jgi:hypothetical protein